MGSSSVTPAIGLPQFGDNDKPTWRGDVNGAFAIIDEVIHGKVDKTTIDYYVVDYGAIGDSVTDDTAHIQSAIDTAAAAGGGVVHLMRGKTHLINGQVFVKNNVTLMGGLSNYNGQTNATNTPSLKFGTATSQIRLGAWKGNNGSVNGDNPSGMHDLLIDANHQGPAGITSGAIYVEGTGIKCSDVHLLNAAGTGLYLMATQNSEFSNVDINGCNVGVCLDNGVGGTLFVRCEISNNQRGIVSVDSSNGTAIGGYPYGAAHVTFQHCIVENYVPAVCEVDIQAGTLQFLNCGFSNNVGTTALSDGQLIKISNPIFAGISSNAIFDTCIFVASGGENLIRVVGNNKFYMYGQNYLQGKQTGSTTAIIQDGGIGLGQIDGNVYKLWINKLLDIANNGSLLSYVVARSTPTQWEVDSAIGQFAILVKSLGDAGIRMAIGNNGSINLYDGTNYTQRSSISLTAALKTLYYNPVGHIMQGPVEFDNPAQFDDTLHALAGVIVDGSTTLNGIVTMGDATHPAEIKGNLLVDGATTHTGVTTHTGAVTNSAAAINNGVIQINAGKTENAPVVYAPAGGGAVTVDAKLTNHLFCCITGTGNITSLVINNAVDGQRLRITYFVIDTPPRNVYWPTAATPGAGKTLPASLAAVGVYSIDFVRVNGNWYEMGRNF